MMQAVSSSIRTASKSTSPILDQVCNGGSAVVLNLARFGKRTSKPLFACDALNKAAIFKYPNFSTDLAAPPTGEAAKSSRERPIETAVFIPYDHDNFQRGGHAIYLRQKNCELLLKQYVGLDIKETSANYEIDVKILQAIDRVPSLDPFLLKDVLAFRSSEIDPIYFTITPEEESAVRENVAEKLRPIVCRAFEINDAQSVSDRTERFLDALWNPALPEGEQFLRALGISTDDPRAIIDGWKGIAYYKFTFDQTKHGIRRLLIWLESKHAVPVGGRRTMHELEQLAMFRKSVVTRVRAVSMNMGSVFKRYDESHSMLLVQDNPEPFRTFLERVHTYYWVLGYCSMALRHSASIFERYVGPKTEGHITFDESQEMLSRLSGTLSSQSTGAL
jgi:hypothetical protein